LLKWPRYLEAFTAGLIWPPLIGAHKASDPKNANAIFPSDPLEQTILNTISNYPYANRAIDIISINAPLNIYACL
jgi:hypothetical protein